MRSRPPGRVPVPVLAAAAVAGVGLELAALELAGLRLTGLDPAALGLGRGPGPALAAHGLGVALLAPALLHIVSPGRAPARGEALFVLVQCLFLPLLGPLLLGLVHGVVVRLPRFREAAGEFIVHRTARGENVTGRLEAPLEAPLLDLLRELDVEHRRRVVLSVSSLDPARAIPILREALRDPDEEVRLFAYGVLSRHEDHLNRQILALQAAPATTSAERAAAAARLGDLYHEFCYLGLAGTQLQRFYLERAAAAYADALALDPEQPRVELKRARVHIRLRDPERAEEALVAAIVGGLPVAETMPWQAEIYFLRGELNLMRGMLQALRREPAIPDRMRRVAAYWRTA
jgi:tetratricopeptide (TPR) repeat protein